MGILIVEVEATWEKEREREREMVIQETRMALYIILMKSTVYIQTKVMRR